MSRQFGIMNVRASLRGGENSPARYRADTQRDLYIPSGSILLPAHPLLKRSKVAQALIDCLAVVFGVMFICVTAASVPAALFILIFVGGR